MELKRLVGNRLLRCGYTTGTCAAAASAAAARLLFTGEETARQKILTPKGIELCLDIEDSRVENETASCAVRKDGGDDIDATHGLMIYASVSKTEGGIEIDGGKGVGRVTKAGLDQAVGSAAINSVPRKMITEAVREVCLDCGYSGGLKIIISVPEGERVGAKTFNPYMGIVGGISILGTSGIVEPMSDRAIIDSARAELKVLRESGEKELLLTIGNYGDRFVSEVLGLSTEKRLKCSNFIGDALSDAVALGFESVLLVGHIGKLVKLGAGITNTHSAAGDARMEIMTACALEAGADIDTLKRIMDCVSTDAALEVLSEGGIAEKTLRILGDRIERTLERKTGGHIKYGAIVFTNSNNRSVVLCKCGAADELLENRRKHDA